MAALPSVTSSKSWAAGACSSTTTKTDGSTSFSSTEDRWSMRKVDATARDRLYQESWRWHLPGCHRVVWHRAHRIWHGRMRRRLRQRRVDRPVRHECGPEPPLSQRWRQALQRRHGQGGVAGSPVFSTSCAFVDIDWDADVDLFVVNYVDARIDNNAYCGDTAKKVRIYCHPLNFAPLAERAVSQQRQRHLHRRQP